MEILTTKDTMVTMRDGVGLAADIYRPATDAPVPALLQQVLYDKNQARPRLRSPASWRPASPSSPRTHVAAAARKAPSSIHEAGDGEDTLRWLTEQP